MRNGIRNAMPAGRQQMITAIAVRAFFESQFAETKDGREAQEKFLERTLPEELVEVTYTPSRRPPDAFSR